MTPPSQSMVPSGENRPWEGTAGVGISVCAQASSQHPADWGRALASAVSQLVQQIIDTTGVDPCREPGGFDLSLHITGLPGGKAITVTWLPLPENTEESSSTTAVDSLRSAGAERDDPSSRSVTAPTGRGPAGSPD